ncbi:DapH/DapD/GlmU-related protein [Bradyrhizobium sp. WSM1253]|uniref:acyltransferase n=1 Tax=Bradyrhizobium sp. WSM1253 TaxID=319003 RepID=UPI00025D2099|nr:acyltransferase [Bradyrhizobium sp. WSM1253]EIG58450.1 hypothetical protein Bra1253DRAFT_03155 [Bradyrhizobium sp. WSM1253]
MIFIKIRLRIADALAKLLLPRQGFEIGKNVRFHGFPVVSQARNSRIIIKDGCVLTSHSSATALGVRSPVILRTLAEGAVIEIGRNSGLSGTVLCAHKGIQIGEGCLMGADVMIFDTDFHPPDTLDRRFAQVSPQNVSEVIVGNNVFIGTRSIVCKGVRIGDNAVIGAGSVVVGDVEPNSIYAGSPARKIRELRFENPPATL